jgi:hypothetical protein
MQTGSVGSSESGDPSTTGAAASTDTSESSGAPPSDACEPFDASTDYAAPGPFSIVSGPEGPECTIFRPEVLGQLGLHPIIIWGNGTTSTPDYYQGILSHWASHGFVVAAANTTDAGSGAEMIACLDYLQTQSETAGSVYDGVLALDRIAASGHSQGGGGSIMAGRDPRITATAPVEAYTQQGFGGYDQAAQAEQVGPMFLITGGADVIAPADPNQQRVWDTVNVPVFWGTKAGVGHIVGVIGAMDDFRHEITAWMRYQLLCDEAAGQLFVDTCTLCTDPDWTVQTMGL